jgi:uncharacterized membrane protein YfcA
VRAALIVAAGVVTGLLSGTFGIGGAVVSTPSIRALGVSAQLAVGTTLPCILPSAIAGTVRYLRESLVSWRVVVWTASAGVLAAVGGALLSRVVPGNGHWLMIATAGVLGYTSWRMARPAQGETERGNGQDGQRGEQRGQEDGDGPDRPRRDQPWVLLAIGAIAGLLSGLLGVGGGAVMIPGFVQVARIPLKIGIASSLVCVGALAVPGTLTHWSLGGIDWPVAGLLCLGVVPGARLGAALAIRARTPRLRLAVAAVLGAIAVVYAAGEAWALIYKT